MLVCKLYEDPKKPIVAGSCNIAYYDTGGWFPIESFDFGFEYKDKEKSAGNNNQGGGSAKGPAGGGSARPGTPPPASGQQKGPAESSEEESKITINKPVDTGTCDLMHLAMRDRKKKKGKESLIKADIHLLSIVDAVGSRWSFPNLMIHLEGVLVKNWQVNASGDERATESLALQYEKAAMQYVSTKDAKEFKYYGPRGWDQTKDEPFTWDGQWQQYLDHLANITQGKKV